MQDLHDHSTVYPFLKGSENSIVPHANRERSTKRVLAAWILSQPGGAEYLHLYLHARERKN